MSGSGSGTASTGTIDGLTLNDYYTRLKWATRDWGKLYFDDTMTKDLVNEGYVDFVRRTHCLKKRYSVALTPATSTYTAPTDMLFPYKYEYDRGQLDVVTADYMDNEYGSRWKDTIADYVSLIVHDNQLYNHFTIYPTFADFSGVVFPLDDNHRKLIVSYDGGTATTVTLTSGDYSGETLASHMEDYIDTALGSTCSVTFDEDDGKFTFDAGTGHTFAITYSGSTVADRIGIFADKSAAQSIETDVAVRIWMEYVYRPGALAATSDEPEFKVDYHPALIHYALYNLLMMSAGSKQDYSTAEYHRRTYFNYVNEAKQDAMLSYSRAPVRFVTQNFLV